MGHQHALRLVEAQCLALLACIIEPPNQRRAVVPDVQSVCSCELEVHHYCLASLLNQLLVALNHPKILTDLAPLM